MPRAAREKSKTGVYHIILRGSNRQEIFHDDEDCMRFLDIIEKYKKQTGIEVYGWCLMNNHVHLIFKEGNEDLSVTMKRIGVSFVWYYNSKYKSTGHLFQDRFKSEKVESDQYLITVVRYVHQNPVKAGMTPKAVEWKWSSCAGYYDEKPYPAKLLDSELVLGIFSANKNIAISRFKNFNEAENNDQCLEDIKRTRLNDNEAKEKIKNLLPDFKIEQIKGLPKAERDEIIKKIKGVEGISQRQIARILGISPNFVFKA